jgi:hypothetical protein
MKRELYKTDRQSYIDVSKYKGLPVKLTVSRVTPKVASLKESLLWNIACLGRIKAYCLFEGDVLVHRSYVIRGKAKFPFLNKNDIEIGPCWTRDSYRGRGYYPYVISRILSSELIGGDTAYMIVNDQNESSKRGISKVGFVKTEYIVTKDMLKRQILRKNEISRTDE